MRAHGLSQRISGHELVKRGVKVRCPWLHTYNYQRSATPFTGSLVAGSIAKSHDLGTVVQNLGSLVGVIVFGRSHNLNLLFTSRFSSPALFVDFVSRPSAASALYWPS